MSSLTGALILSRLSKQSKTWLPTWLDRPVNTPCAKLVSSCLLSLPLQPLKAQMPFHLPVTSASSQSEDLIPPLQNSDHYLPSLHLLLASFSLQAKVSTCLVMYYELWYSVPPHLPAPASFDFIPWWKEKQKKISSVPCCCFSQIDLLPSVKMPSISPQLHPSAWKALYMDPPT